MKDLTVFVLTHNRGEMLLETIDSILNQSCHDFKFIVSDNSSNDETMRLLEERGYLGKFEYRKRDKEYPSMEHFNLCLSEVDTTYFVLFHDDDIMLQDYVETMYSSIAGSEYVAVGCNARYLLNDKLGKKMCNISNDIIFKNTHKLIEAYCRNSIVPFPSYIYSKTRINGKKISDIVGKYSDVTWLISLCNENNIKWIKKVGMNYRIHVNQDSQKKDYRNLSKLYKIFKENGCNFSLVNKKRLYSIYENFLSHGCKFCLRKFFFLYKYSKIISIKYFLRHCLKKWKNSL